MHAHTLLNTIKTIQGKHGSKAKKAMLPFLRAQTLKKIYKKVLSCILLYVIVFIERR